MRPVFFLKLFAAVKLILKRFKRDNLNEYAAYSALFIILSFVPFILLLLNVIKFLPFISAPESYAPDLFKGDVGRLILQIFNETSEKATGAILSITTLAALWSASRGLIGIINGLNRIHRANETRGFLRLRLSAAIYTLLFIAALITVLLLLVFGRAILARAEELFPVLEGAGGLMFSLRWAVGFCILILLFLFIYAALPIQKGKPFSKLPGAVFSASGWLIFSGLYSFYVNDLANYSYVYGSLATIALLVLWLYICMYILFLGEELNFMLSSGFLRKAAHWVRKVPALNEKEKEKKDEHT